MDNKDFRSKDVLDTVANATPPAQPGATMPKLTNEVGDAMPNLNPATSQGQSPTPNNAMSSTPYVPVSGPPNAVVGKPAHDWRKITAAVIMSGLFFAGVGLLVGWFVRDGEVEDLKQNVNELQEETQETPIIDDDKEKEEPEEEDPVVKEDDDEKGEPEEEDPEVELEALVLSDETRITFEKSEFSEVITIDRMPEVESAAYYNYGIQSRTVTNYLIAFEAVQTCNTPGSFGYFDFFEAEERLQSEGVPNGYESVVEINELAEEENSLLRRIDDNLYVRYIGASPPCFIELIVDPQNKTNEDDIVKLVEGLETDPIEDAKEVLKTFAIVE